MKGWFGLGGGGQQSPKGKPSSISDEARAGELLEAAQSALNSLRLQTSQSQSFVAINSAQRTIGQLKQLVGGFQGDLRVVWGRCECGAAASNSRRTTAALPPSPPVAIYQPR